MTKNYEESIGPINPGFYKPISPELQKTIRDMERDKERDRVWVSLSTSHNTLQPEAISELLQLTPDHVQRTGDTIYRNDRHHITSDGTYWSLSSSGHVRGNELEKHLSWMLDQLFGKLPAVRSLQQDGSRFVIHAHMDLASPVAVPILDVRTIQRLAQLHTSLQFVIRYQIDEDEDDDDDTDQVHNIE